MSTMRTRNIIVQKFCVLFPQMRRLEVHWRCQKTLDLGTVFDKQPRTFSPQMRSQASCDLHMPKPKEEATGPATSPAWSIRCRAAGEKHENGYQTTDNSTINPLACERKY